MAGVRCPQCGTHYANEARSATIVCTVCAQAFEVSARLLFGYRWPVVKART